MRELLQAESSKEFLKHSREGVKAFIAQRGSNRSGHSLAVVEYENGGRRGFVIIPEGRG